MTINHTINSCVIRRESGEVSKSSCIHTSQSNTVGGAARESCESECPEWTWDSHIHGAAIKWSILKYPRVYWSHCCIQGDLLVMQDARGGVKGLRRDSHPYHPSDNKLS